MKKGKELGEEKKRRFIGEHILQVYRDLMYSSIKNKNHNFKVAYRMLKLAVIIDC